MAHMKCEHHTHLWIPDLLEAKDATPLSMEGILHYDYKYI